MYSFTERKIGKYFNDDLYEKCYSYSDIVDDIIEIEGANKIIDVSGFVEIELLNGHLYDHTLFITSPSTRSMTGGIGIEECCTVTGYDYLDSENPAFLEISTAIYNVEYGVSDGIFKVQYTKLSE